MPYILRDILDKFRPIFYQFDLRAIQIIRDTFLAIFWPPTPTPPPVWHFSFLNHWVLKSKKICVTFRRTPSPPPPSVTYYLNDPLYAGHKTSPSTFYWFFEHFRSIQTWPWHLNLFVILYSLGLEIVVFDLYKFLGSPAKEIKNPWGKTDYLEYNSLFACSPAMGNPFSIDLTLA